MEQLAYREPSKLEKKEDEKQDKDSLKSKNTNRAMTDQLHAPNNPSDC